MKTKLSSVRIDIGGYARNHGRAPRGFGLWAFAFGREYTPAGEPLHVEFFGPCLYSRAAAEARRTAAGMNEIYLEVLS